MRYEITAHAAYGTLCFLRCTETYEPEAPTNALIITHNLCGCDVTKFIETCAKSFIIDFIMNVFYINI
jgi:hypothetical protein